MAGVSRSDVSRLTGPMVDRFLSCMEHRAANQDHPNVVHVHSVGSHRGVHYYAMQFIEGQTVADVIAHERRRRGLDDRASQTPAGPESSAHAPTIELAVAPGSDAGYLSVELPDVSVVNMDNDEPVVLFSESSENGQWDSRWIEGSQNDWFTSTQRETDGNHSAEVDGRATDATLTMAQASPRHTIYQRAAMMTVTRLSTYAQEAPST